MGFKAKRVARRVLKALADSTSIRSFFLTTLCLKGWADAKLNKPTAPKEVTLDLEHLRLCVDVARVELISYWRIWYERCYDAIAMERPRCVVDVGANIGAFSLYQTMVKDAEQVVAFEPSPQVFPRLVRNVEINGPRNVRVVNAAVGARQGTVSFMEARKSINGQVTETGTLTVPCVTLDSEVSDIPAIDILKINTEGYETRVLEGACETLKKTKRIALELHYPGERQEIESILFPLGFSLEAVQGDLVFYRERN
jgi:FkbM family methyltransferase